MCFCSVLCGFVLLGSMINFSSTAGVHSHSSSSTFPFSLTNKDRINFLYGQIIFSSLYFPYFLPFRMTMCPKQCTEAGKKTLHRKLAELFMSERTWGKKIIAKMKQLRGEERKRLKTSLSCHQPSNPFLCHSPPSHLVHASICEQVRRTEPHRVQKVKLQNWDFWERDCYLRAAKQKGEKTKRKKQSIDGYGSRVALKLCVREQWGLIHSIQPAQQKILRCLSVIKHIGGRLSGCLLCYAYSLVTAVYRDEKKPYWL